MRPSILIIGNLLSSTLGVRSVSEDLAARLSAAGWKVIAASEKPGRLARLTDMCLTVWRRRVEYEVANVEVFSGMAFRWAQVVCFLLRRLNKPYILTLHGGNLPNFARRRAGRTRRLLNSARFVTTPSRYLLEQMSAYRPDLVLLPNPLNLEAYQYRRRDRATPKLVWLRAFHKIYNPTLAPRVVKQLAGEFPEIHLEMIGPDKNDGSAKAVREVISELEVSRRVSQIGVVAKAQVPHYLNGGDVFLNTANVDNTPVSVLEAMACGLCVVSANVGGIPYLLEDERDALLVPPDDSRAMAAAVRRILTSPRLAETLSQNARKKAESHDWAVILPQWERLFESAVKGSAGLTTFSPSRSISGRISGSISGRKPEAK
jgi:glycosyltransferase involved in cell wall biosynthesis